MSIFFHGIPANDRRRERLMNWPAAHDSPALGRCLILPDTPYFNYVRSRRSIDPVRFDYWHPQIGALIGMEISGIPTTPTTIVSKNAHFNAAADRKLHAENPQRFDQTKPVRRTLPFGDSRSRPDESAAGHCVLHRAASPLRE